MADRGIVLDFDGTITDAEAEGAPFRAAYLDDLAMLAGLGREEVEAMAVDIEAAVAANAADEGWIWDGAIVAPATVDPYLRMMPVARRILDHAGAFTEPTERARLLEGVLYKHNYRLTRLAFRPGAAEVLPALAAAGAVVVTNSHTEAVQEKIRALAAVAAAPAPLLALAAGVRGRTRKYQIDPSWDAVPPSLTLPGLARPVLLRRRAYCEALDAVRAAGGGPWSDLVVGGDIFELDLCLPLALGARIVLVTNPHTPPWERAYLAAQPRAALVDGLPALAAALGISPSSPPLTPG